MAFVVAGKKEGRNAEFILIFFSHKVMLKFHRISLRLPAELLSHCDVFQSTVITCTSVFISKLRKRTSSIFREWSWKQSNSSCVHYMQLCLRGWGSAVAGARRWRRYGEPEKPGVWQCVAVLPHVMWLTDFVPTEYGFVGHNTRSCPWSPCWRRQRAHGPHTEGVLQGPVAPGEGGLLLYNCDRKTTSMPGK